jgi:hypothetical protein
MLKNASILHIFYEISLGSEQIQIIVTITIIKLCEENVKKKKILDSLYRKTTKNSGG